ncbi:MAG: M24 family metallopeptidase [Rhodospirillales bacterium]
MTTPIASALAADVPGRIARVQAAMRDAGVDALLVHGHGSPDGMGLVRYLANARAWAGRIYAVLGRTDPDPGVLSHSGYQAAWTRAGGVGGPGRGGSPAGLIGRTATRLGAAAGPGGRIGVAGLQRLTLAEHAAFTAALDGMSLVDMTAPVDALRRRKSAAEVAAFRENGDILDRAIAVFGLAARVGAPCAAACAAAEAEVRAHGGFWGRSKLAFGASPITIPPEPDRRFGDGDVFTFELVFESPHGYWTEMTALFAFGPLPAEAAALHDAYLAAFEAARAAARPGVTMGEIAALTDATIASRGFAVGGKHTPDCHSIGLDGGDGPGSIASPETVLAEDMVLSMHPGTQLADGRAYLVSDNVLVTPDGGVRLSGLGLDRRLVRLPVAS